MSCTCSECKNKYKIDIVIDDKLWEIIKPPNTDEGLLCGSCICKKLETLNMYDAFSLVRIS